MYEITIREISRRARRLWLRLRIRFNAEQLGVGEINEMTANTQLFWRDYWNNQLLGQPIRFVGIQGVIILSTGARYYMRMSVAIRTIEDYIRTAFDYLELMSGGVDIFANGLNVRISGEDLVDPLDIRSGRIDFKIGFDMLYPTRNILPTNEINLNFEYEDQQPDDDQQQQQSSDQGEEEYNNEIQINRYNELRRRIELLEEEVRDLDYNIAENRDILISLRVARNRWSSNVQNIRNDVENQLRTLTISRNRIDRQLRALRRLFNSGEELSSSFEPDTEIYSSSDYSNFQNSPFSVPSEYLDEDFDDLLNYINSPTGSQNALFNMFNVSSPSFHSPSSSDASTELMSERELEELERQERINELLEQISQADYQIAELNDLLRDLRNRKINRKSEEYLRLLNSFESQKREITILLKQWQRELRSLRRNID